MNVKILGCFYFKRTCNGNLIGEFCNDKNNKVYTESADLMEATSAENPFAGNYYSSWQERGKENFARLEIKLEKNSSRIYSLKWEIEKDKIKHYGNGIVCDNMLIGNYYEREQD